MTLRTNFKLGDPRKFALGRRVRRRWFGGAGSAGRRFRLAAGPIRAGSLTCGARYDFLGACSIVSADPRVVPSGPPRQLTEQLQALEATITAEIPLSARMGVAVESFSAEGLVLSMPLELNRNPHQTAFAGSLNALCTLAGWGMTHLLLVEHGFRGQTVLRRSSIKYREPVEAARVAALCLPPPPGDLAHFLEMLREKGQAKLELGVQIAGGDADRPAVLFGGSYVITRLA